VLGVADEFGMDWKIAHDAFVAYADEVLPDAPTPVRVLGLDETRRGKGRYEVVTSTGVKVWVDRFDTGLVDLDGTGGLFAQVTGRNSAAVIAWLEQQDPEWRAITHVSMDTSATYARAARIALPRAVVMVESVPPGAAGEPGAHRVPAGTDLGHPRTARPEGRPGMGAAEPRCTTTRCAPPTRPVAWRSVGRQRNLLRNLLTLARTGGPDQSLIWRRLTDFYTHCASVGIDLPRPGASAAVGRPGLTTTCRPTRPGAPSWAAEPSCSRRRAPSRSAARARARAWPAAAGHERPRFGHPRRSRRPTPR